jgi:uncharacterized membrane protein
MLGLNFSVHTLVLLMTIGYIMVLTYLYIRRREAVQRTWDVHLAMVALMLFTLLLWWLDTVIAHV